MTQKLWSIYLSGMDEYVPAPNEAAAHHMATKHNASMDEYFAKNPSDDTGVMPSRESVSARVDEWPFGPEDHAIDLEDFDYQAWGMAA